jgi:predicted dehydrogenase
MSGPRLAVIGAGHMGRFHAEKVAALSGEVELVGVCDLEENRAKELGEALGVAVHKDWRELLGRIEAAVVAVPTINHFPVVEGLLAAGVDVLVEKPIAAVVSEAEKLWALARKNGRVLQVGHLEWFNSAMRSAVERVNRPRFIEAHRLGPFPARATDVDVVRDLMIHDIDIIQRLVGEEPERIEAIGVPVLTQRVDIANARLVFPARPTATSRSISWSRCW